MSVSMNGKPHVAKQRQIFEYHPVIAYRYIPGIRARIPHEEGGGFLIEVNEAGFRCGHNFTAEKPAGTRRVLLFGDSFAAGDGVSNGKRFGDLLEQQLPNMEVYNFALPGTGTDQQYLTYKEFAQGIDYDLIVISVFVENIRRVAARYRFFTNENGEQVIFAKPYFELQQGQLSLHNVPVEKDPLPAESLQGNNKSYVDYGLPMKKLVRQIDKVGGKQIGSKMTQLLDRWGIKDMLQKNLAYQPIPEYSRPDHPAWLTMRAILEEWINSQSKPVLLLLIPLSYHVEGVISPVQYQARFRELERAVGCTVYDPLPQLRALPADERKQLYYREGHLNSAGHAALAQLLAPVVDQLLRN